MAGRSSAQVRTAIQGVMLAKGPRFSVAVMATCATDDAQARSATTLIATGSPDMFTQTQSGGSGRCRMRRTSRALCVETHESWLEDKRYLNMDVLWEAPKEQLRKAA